MKILPKWYRMDSVFDMDVKYGIGWFRHHKDHKWFGFTFVLYLWPYKLDVTYVNNYVEYQKRMNYRSTKKND